MHSNSTTAQQRKGETDKNSKGYNTFYNNRDNNLKDATMVMKEQKEVVNKFAAGPSLVDFLPTNSQQQQPQEKVTGCNTGPHPTIPIPVVGLQKESCPVKLLAIAAVATPAAIATPSIFSSTMHSSHPRIQSCNKSQDEYTFFCNIRNNLEDAFQEALHNPLPISRSMSPSLTSVSAQSKVFTFSSPNLEQLISRGNEDNEDNNDMINYDSLSNGPTERNRQKTITTKCVSTNVYAAANRDVPTAEILVEHTKELKRQQRKQRIFSNKDASVDVPASGTPMRHMADSEETYHRLTYENADKLHDTAKGNICNEDDDSIGDDDLLNWLDAELNDPISPRGVEKDYRSNTGLTATATKTILVRERSLQKELCLLKTKAVPKAKSIPTRCSRVPKLKTRAPASIPRSRFPNMQKWQVPSKCDTECYESAMNLGSDHRPTINENRPQWKNASRIVEMGRGDSGRNSSLGRISSLSGGQAPPPSNTPRWKNPSRKGETGSYESGLESGANQLHKLEGKHNSSPSNIPHWQKYPKVEEAGFYDVGLETNSCHLPALQGGNDLSHCNRPQWRNTSKDQKSAFPFSLQDQSRVLDAGQLANYQTYHHSNRHQRRNLARNEELVAPFPSDSPIVLESEGEQCPVTHQPVHPCNRPKWRMPSRGEDTSLPSLTYDKLTPRDDTGSQICGLGKWIPKLHEAASCCDWCLFNATPEGRRIFIETGSHYEINRVRGGCSQNCRVFPVEEMEQPVRLCRSCFYTTHKMLDEHTCDFYRGDLPINKGGVSHTRLP